MGPGADQRHLPGALYALPGNRGLIPPTPRKIWGFLGDGEMDEPESMGSLTLASREKLDNLISSSTAIYSGWTGRCAAMAR